MLTISVCMIVKDEEAVLERCLACVKQFADEIIIVDTGSSDRTKEIAYSFTKQVFDYPWIDDFAAARNEAFSKASCEYVMWLDADDVILDEDIAKLKRLKQQGNHNVDIFLCKYDTEFDEQGAVVFSYYRERIIKNDSSHQWVGAVHETIALQGKLEYLDIAIRHQKLVVNDPLRNLRIFEKQLDKGVVLTPREQFYYARELYNHQFYQRSADLLEQFLNDGQGWKENCISACQILGYCAYFLGNEKYALRCFLRSFIYDEPRAEICCDIGKHFLDRKQYHQAIFWYETALSRRIDATSGAFIEVDCYGYLPCLQLCVCWWQLGDKDKAFIYHKRAANYKPDSAEVQRNAQCFRYKKQDD